MTDAQPARALLLHSEPGEVIDVLSSAEGLEWRVATDAESVLNELARKPGVVVSIKHSEFPGEAHRPAAECPSVRWFHVGGSGRDHLAGIDRPDLRVTDCAGVLAPFLAERAMAALLALSTGTDAFLRAQAERAWRPTRFTSLAGRTLLIVGAGHVGTELARRARSFGMRILGIRASGRAREPFDEMHAPDSLEALLPRADVLSIHVRLTEATRGRFGAPEFALLPPGAIVMNSARGAVLDEAALLDALSNDVAAAWLDVFEREPLPAASPLWSHPRILVTPHCADQVADFPRRFARRFVDLWRQQP